MRRALRNIKWVNSGADKATVLVKGWNFFSGTKVVIDGVVHREEDGSLTLKSSQALEFETPLASLLTGDSVLSGRFGSSRQLTVEKDKALESLSIVRAVIEPNSFAKEIYIEVDIKGLDKNGDPVDLKVEDIQKLPEPILFLGTEPIRMPYDYFDVDPNEDARDSEQTAKQGDTVPLGRTDEATIEAKPGSTEPLVTAKDMSATPKTLPAPTSVDRSESADAKLSETEEEKKVDREEDVHSSWSLG